jgi:M6 family metalloprotease-like protein
VLLTAVPRVSSAQLPPQLAPWSEVGPPAPIAGLVDARPYSPLEFSRAWLGKVARVRTRRSELRAEGRLDGMSPAEAAELGGALAGELRVPVIPVRYADVAVPFSNQVLAERLFGPGAGDTVSYSGYFAEVSGGLLRVDGAVAPWVRLRRDARHYLPREHYGWARFGRIDDLRQEALRAADAWLDFGEYDNDGPDGVPNSGDDDGYVDFVAFVYAVSCPGDGRDGGIWPHRAAMQPIETRDRAVGGGAIVVADYVILPAVDPATCAPLHVGLLAHETGHALGLPDLYDYDASSQGIGGWGLMGTGSHGDLYSPAHPSAWEKEQLGWVRVRWLESDSAALRLAPVETDATVYRFDVPDAGGRYLLLENRQRIGSDRRLPGHGLLLWRVDPERGELGAWNTDERRSAVGLIEADGRAEMTRGHRADSGDPFPGITGRTEHHSWADQDFRITDIAERSGVVTARLAIGQAPPSLQPETPVVRLTGLGGGARVRHTVAITRSGGAQFGFRVATNSEWLRATSARDTIELTADPSDRLPGAHTDTVRLIDAAGATAARIVVSFYVATPGIGQIVATELPWSWGLAARDGQILQASYGWDPLGLRPRPRVLEIREGATHPATLTRLPSDALYSPAIDGAGTAYVLARAHEQNFLYRLTPEGAEVVAAQVGDGPAYGAAALPDGGVLVAEWSGRIHRVAADGSAAVWDSIAGHVYQIATDARGTVFAATYAGDILRIDPDGGRVTIPVGYGSGRLVAVAAAPDGAVFAAERGGQGRIERIDAAGRRQVVFQRDGAQFYGVAVDGVFLYALDLAERQLLRIPLPEARPNRMAGGAAPGPDR